MIPLVLAPLAQAAETVGVGFFEVFAIALTGLYALVKSYGLAIILLTLGVRILLLPLSIKQTRSMREMQLIQPEVKKLQTKHKGDRQKMNEEMMKLYKEHGVNPFGGCLPLLMQFPVLISLFYVIRTPLAYMGYMTQEVAGGVNWVPYERVQALLERAQVSDLARQLDTAPLAINRFLGLRLDCAPSGVLAGEPSATVPDVACGTGVLSFLPYLVLILLMGYTTYYQQKQMQARQDGQSPQMQQMQTFMKIMPVMLMVFSFNFPTGVVLYWLTTNVWTIIQQRIILKAAPPVAPKKEKKEEGEAPPAAKGDAPRKPPEAAKGAADPGGGRPSRTGSPSGRSRHSRKRKKKKR